MRLFNPLTLVYPGASTMVATATFGVFDWFQVTDFNGFLSFFMCHFILLSCFGLLFLLCQ
jgi:hypothetical protein